MGDQALSWRANHIRKNLAQGGRLTASDDRLTFEPHAFPGNRALGGPSQWAKTDIESVRLASRSWSPAHVFAAGLRRRLSVVLRGNNTEELFVVPHPRTVVEALSSWLTST